jgi:hypothetical protein
MTVELIYNGKVITIDDDNLVGVRVWDSISSIKATSKYAYAIDGGLGVSANHAIEVKYAND